MKNLVEKVNEHKSNFRFIIFAALALSAIINLASADYNFVGFAYAWYVWEYCYDLKEQQQVDKLILFYYWILSLFFDVYLFFYWKALYEGIYELDNESTIHCISLWARILLITLKLVIILIVGIHEAQQIHSALPKVLKEKLNSNYAEQKDGPETA